MLPTRPIPKCCDKNEVIFDPPRIIQKAMGGTPFFFETGAKFIHRVGLMRGLGWVLPVGESGRDINYIRVAIREGGCGTYDILFGKRRDMREGLPVGEGIEDPFSIDTIALVESVPAAKLREVYDRETMK